MLIHMHVNYEGSDFMKFEVITDLRILKGIGRRYNLQFDKDYKYCIKDNDSWGNVYHDLNIKVININYNIYQGAFILIS